MAGKQIVVAAAMLAGLSLTGGDALARDGWYDLPPGPYRQECRGERIERGYLLMARCPKQDGAMRDASLDLRTCPRNMVVRNEGAYLRCYDAGRNAGGYNGRDRDDGWRDGRRGGYDLPQGPYRRVCRNERVVNGYMLMASCPKDNGEMRDASLDLRTCGRGTTIFNEGAYLRCR
jgi:hypothetical protein